MAAHPGSRGKYPRLSSREQEDQDKALEPYLLNHVPGLKEHHEAQHEAFLRIAEDALVRHPDPTPADIAAAEAAEAALPSRKRTEFQLRRSFTPLATHLPSEVIRSRKRFIQKTQRAWNRANPTPMTSELQSAPRAEFIKRMLALTVHKACFTPPTSTSAGGDVVGVPCAATGQHRPPAPIS